MPAREPLPVLHYLGADDDHGGIVSVIRALAATGSFRCTLGVNPHFVQHRPNPLPVVSLPPLRAEVIGGANLWRARGVAQAVRRWLHADPAGVFHAHTRAGLLVALWLRRLGERRVVVSVHCYGRQRWSYRWAARHLGARLYWLTPAMKAYYGVGTRDWAQCIPNSLPGEPAAPRRRPLQPGRLALGGAGMLVRWKRWETVLQAIAQLPDDVRGAVSFTHIGAAEETEESRQYAAELHALTSRLGLSAQVQWQGWQPSSADLLRHVDAIVVPSCREPFSMIALEALFAGVPVLAADEGGPPDLLERDRSGWLFDGENPRALAGQLAALLAGDALSRVVIDAGMLRRFAADVVAQQWLDAYQAVGASD